MSNSGGIGFISKWGERPNTSKLEFTITSAKLEAFLRAKFQFVIDGLVRKNVNVDFPDVNNISVRAMGIGDYFAPLVVTLPPEILNQSQYNPAIPEVFQNDNAGYVPIHEVYYRLLQRFMFSKRDVDAIHSSAMRRNLRIHRQDRIREFVTFTTPRVIYSDERDGNNRKQIRGVCIFLDPSPMIYEMLRNDIKPTVKYRTSYVDIKVYKDSDSASYTVLREELKYGKGRNDYAQSVEQLAARMTQSM